MELKKLTGKKLKSFECWQQNPYFKKRGYFTDEKIISDTFKVCCHYIDNFDSLDMT